MSSRSIRHRDGFIKFPLGPDSALNRVQMMSSCSKRRHGGPIDLPLPVNPPPGDHNYGCDDVIAERGDVTAERVGSRCRPKRPVNPLGMTSSCSVRHHGVVPVPPPPHRSPSREVTAPPHPIGLWEGPQGPQRPRPRPHPSPLHPPPRPLPHFYFYPPPRGANKNSSFDHVLSRGRAGQGGTQGGALFTVATPPPPLPPPPKLGGGAVH